MRPSSTRQPALQEVDRRIAQERSHEHVARPLVDLVGRADLLDDAVAHHHDAVGQRQRLGLVVRDVDERRLHRRCSCLISRAWRSAARHPGWTAARPSGRPPAARTMARPSATRWRWPPESWLGPALQQLLDFQSCARHPAPAGRSPRFGTLRMRSPKAMFSYTDLVRIERVALEHHRHVALVRRHVVDDLVVEPAARRRSTSSSPAIMLSVVDLPQPDGPSSTRNSLSRYRGSGLRAPAKPLRILLRHRLAIGCVPWLA